MIHRRLLYVWVGLLCLGVLLQAGLAVFLVHETNVRQQEDSKQIEQISDTVRQLCDRGYLIADVLLALQDFAMAQPPLAGRAVFLQQIDLSYNEILDEITRPGAPCVR